MEWIIVGEIGLLVIFGLTAASDIKEMAGSLEKVLYEIREIKQGIKKVDDSITLLRR